MKRIIMALMLVLCFVGCINPLERMAIVQEKFPDADIVQLPDSTSLYIVREPDGSIYCVSIYTDIKAWADTEMATVRILTPMKGL